MKAQLAIAAKRRVAFLGKPSTSGHGKLVLDKWTCIYFAERVHQRIGDVASGSGLRPVKGILHCLEYEMAGGVAWLNGHLLEFQNEQGECFGPGNWRLGRDTLVISTESGLLNMICGISSRWSGGQESAIGGRCQKG